MCQENGRAISPDFLIRIEQSDHMYIYTPCLIGLASGEKELRDLNHTQFFTLEGGRARDNRWELIFSFT